MAEKEELKRKNNEKWEKCYGSPDDGGME